MKVHSQIQFSTLGCMLLNCFYLLQQAYRRWVCSSLVPHYTRSGERVRPCLSVCEDVEQQCPYLLPDQTILPGEAAHPTPQYAGEPTFLCLGKSNAILDRLNLEEKSLGFGLFFFQTKNWYSERFYFIKLSH